MPTRKLITTYEDDLTLFPDFWHKVGIALGIVAALIFPFVAQPQWVTIANTSMVAIVGSVGLMILTGFCGQISLGHAAFLALGAYAAAITGEQLQLPFWLGLPLGGIVSAAAGLLVGPFALRLRGLYLAIVTIGLIALVNHTLLSFPEYTHGASGIAVPAYGWFPAVEEVSAYGTLSKPTTIGPLEFELPEKLYFLYLLLAAMAAFASKNIQRSDLGRAMVAVRDHDIAAAVLGVNPAQTKVIAFGVSSFFAGIAGAMFAYQQQYITVEPPFDLSMSIMYIAIIVVGGIGTTFGAVAGAIFYVAMTPFTELVGKHLPLISQLSSGQQSTLLFAVLVCFFLIAEPLGLLGIWLRIKRYFTAWPFRY